MGNIKDALAHIIKRLSKPDLPSDYLIETVKPVLQDIPKHKKKLSKNLKLYIAEVCTKDKITKENFKDIEYRLKQIDNELEERI